MPTVPPLSSAGPMPESVERDQAAERTLRDRQDPLRAAARRDLGGDVDPVGDAEVGLAGVDQLQRVGRRGRLDDLEVDALVLVIALRERLVDPGVDRPGHESSTSVACCEPLASVPTVPPVPESPPQATSMTAASSGRSGARMRCPGRIRSGYGGRHE